MLFFPTTLLGGILFQLIVFIFERGVGVSCCGNCFNESEVVSFGVFGLVTSLDALRELGGGGHAGGWGAFMGGGGGIGAEQKGRTNLLNIQQFEKLIKFLTCRGRGRC